MAVLAGDITYTGGVVDAIYQCEYCGACIADGDAVGSNRTLHAQWHEDTEP